MPEIIYLNGRRVAMGDDLEPIVFLTMQSLATRRLVAVKLLPTATKKVFNGTEQKNRILRKSPNPNDLRIEFLTAAILLPSLSTKSLPTLLPSKSLLALSI